MNYVSIKISENYHMTTIYQLIAHLRNVDIFEESIGKHAGYVSNSVEIYK